MPEQTATQTAVDPEWVEDFVGRWADALELAQCPISCWA